MIGDTVVFKGGNGSIYGKVDGEYFFSKKDYLVMNSFGVYVEKNVLILCSPWNVVVEKDPETFSKIVRIYDNRNTLILKNGKKYSVHDVKEEYDHLVIGEERFDSMSDEEVYEATKEQCDEVCDKGFVSMIEKRIAAVKGVSIKK